jgi:cell filamentation protein
MRRRITSLRYRTAGGEQGVMQPGSHGRVLHNLLGITRKREMDIALKRFTPCWPGTATDISHALAVVHAELLLIHPFREGNGRLARWLADLMAAQAGLYLPKYQFTGRGAQASRAEYLEAVQRGYAGDYRALETFFARALERGRGA